MRKLFFIWAMLLAQFAFAQFHMPVQFSVKQNRISDTELEIVFTGKVDAGWHVYSTDIPDGGPTKAELTLEKQEGVKTKGALRATGKVHRAVDDMFGMELSYMEGTASFSQKFTVTASSYEVSGYLTYGACNDENCIPPTNVDFSFKGTGPSAKEEVKPAAEDSKKEAELTREPEPVDSINSDTLSVITQPTSAENSAGVLWEPVIDELKAFAQGTQATGSSDKGWLMIFLMGLLGGLAALLTPCVWPIIPMTVSFFLKRNKDDRSKGIRDAVTYGLSIIVIYMALGLLVTLLYTACA